RGEFTEGTRLLFEVQEIGERGGLLLVAVLRIRAPEQYEALRLIERQWPQQHRIDDAEDGRVCADAQGERDDADEREDRISAEHSQAVAKILKQRIHNCSFQRARLSAPRSIW